MKIEVTLKWAGDVVDVRRLDVGSSLVIGTHPEADLCVPLPDSADGAWAMTDRASLVLDDQPRTMQLGAFTLETKPAQREKRVFLAPVFDVLWANTATITMFAMGALLAIMTLLPTGLDELDDALLTSAPRATSLILRKQPPPPPAVVAAGESGQGKSAVRSDAKPRPASPSATKSMEALFGPNGGIAQLLVANGDEALMASLGQIHGERTASLGGGLLPIGQIGGADRGTGTVGIGRIGTLPDGGGYGVTEGTLWGKEDRGPMVVTEREPRIVGALDKDIIRRVVKEHEAQVRYCYESSLQRRPGLAGKVTVQFLIGGDGHVRSASADESTLHDADAERCLITKVRTWVFPAPRGGGVVVVNYPFVFKAG